MRGARASRTDRGDRRQRAAGFTLVELVTVLTILGVLAAFVGPRFFSQQTFGDRSYVDELAAALRFAQKAAVISGCPARLTLAATSYTGSQQAAAGNACSPTDTTWSTPLAGPDGDAIQGAAPSGTTAGPAGVFQFDDQGRLQSSPATTITVGSHTLTIDANSGLVQVQ
jgi:MSHA pilin protein MshC